MSPSAGTPRRAGVLAGVLLLAALCGGCAGDPPPYGPTGVDELVIPSPSPDPSDFVRRVDNPWFPVEPGMRWTYRTADGPDPTVRVVAARGPVIGGVRTSELRTTTAGSTTTDFYAQDTSGNVWWFGRAGRWRVGPGVPAGLMMAADPRRGDGYVMARAPRADVRGMVVDTGRSWQGTGLGSSDRAVVIEVISHGVAEVDSFVPHLGMVQQGQTGLVAFDQPRR